MQNSPFATGSPMHHSRRGLKKGPKKTCFVGLLSVMLHKHNLALK